MIRQIKSGQPAAVKALAQRAALRDVEVETMPGVDRKTVELVADRRCGASRVAQLRRDHFVYCSRLCALEGFSAHQEQADLRVRRYGRKVA